MCIDNKKNFIKENGKTKLVNELVTGMDMPVEDAVDYVYDMIVLTKEEFSNKYFNGVE